jgi:hypothetical protein
VRHSVPSAAVKRRGQAMSTNGPQIDEINELIRCVELQIAKLERERDPIDEFAETDRYYELTDQIAALREQRRLLEVRWNELSGQEIHNT